MPAKSGREAKLYRNTGSFAVPVWDEIPNVRDLTLNLTAEEIDIGTRGTGAYMARIPGRKDGTADFEMVHDENDADMVALETSFHANPQTSIEFAILSGAIATSGSRGLRATMAVMNFSRNEPIGDALTVSVTISITYSTNAPSWMIVP